jgi:hypothetical protein
VAVVDDTRAGATVLIRGYLFAATKRWLYKDSSVAKVKCYLKLAIKRLLAIWVKMEGVAVVEIQGVLEMLGPSTSDTLLALPFSQDLFLTIPDYTRYRANGKGDILDSKTGNIVAPRNMRGRRYVDLCNDDNTRDTVTVARAVCAAKYGRWPDTFVHACHIDGDRTNDQMGNLRFADMVNNDIDDIINAPYQGRTVTTIRYLKLAIKRLLAIWVKMEGVAVVEAISIASTVLETLGEIEEEEEEMTDELREDGGGCGNRKDDNNDDDDDDDDNNDDDAAPRRSSHGVRVTPSPPTSPADAAPRRSSRLRVTKKDRERDREAWLELQKADETEKKRARRM